MLAGVWAAGALCQQVLSVRRGGPDYSQPAGSPARGLLYNLTLGMLPTRKESARLHPGKFAVGIVMHLGTLACLALVVVSLIDADAGLRGLTLLRPLVAVALLAGLYLLVRRGVSRNLRAMSVPDDYVAIALTCGLLGLSLAAPLFAQGRATLLGYAAVLLVYLPLGKLRHAVFFFLSRGELGSRLGYRGAYPPLRARTE